MSDIDTDAPLDSPPTNFDHITYTSLDPEKPDDPLPFDSGREGLEQAADEFSHQTKAERNEITERTWGDPRDWSKHAPGNRSVSAEHASDMLKETRETEARLAQAEIDAATARAVDDFRGDAAQPQQPEFEQTQPQQPELQPQLETAPAEVSELDRMLAELPEHRRAPFVAAFNEMVSRAQYQAQTSYQEAVQQAQATANQFQQAAVQAIQVGEAVARQPFPELHNVPDAELPAVLGHIARTNPQRHAQILGHVAQVKQALGQQLHAAQVIHHQQTQAQLQQQAAARQEAAARFQQWAAREDDKVDKLLATETPERRTAIQQEAAAILREEGLTDQQIGNLWNSDATFRSATSQKLLMKEAKARIAERGVRAARVTPVAHVQRPEVASEESRDYSEYSHLERQYRGQPLTAKQAAELVIAKRARR